MVKKLLLTGLVGASMMGVVGCGGGSEDSLPAPTGKIAKSEANGLQRLVNNTGLDPHELLSQGGGGASSKMARMLSRSEKDTGVIAGGASSDEWEWKGEHACGLSGTYTIKLISGVHPNDPGREVNASKLVYEYITDKCIWYEGGIEETGTRKRVKDWKEENGVLTENWSGSTENYVYKLDNTHKFTTTTASWHGTDVMERESGEYYPFKAKYESHYVRSAKVVDGNTTYELKNIARDKTTIWDNHEMTYSRKWELSGAIKSDEFDGWIVIDTPVALEKNQDDEVTEGEVRWRCNHKGKMTISGKEHTVTTEAYADHKIDVKYDDEVIKSYANCIKYHQDQ